MTDQNGEPSILAKIKAYKLEEIAQRKAARPATDVEASAKEARPPRSFTAALEAAIAVEGVALIAEIKKASPSKGLIREDFEPRMLAMAYEEGGAACLSVLTDEPSFQGRDAYLTAARTVVSVPVLRKDFMYDTYQVAEARALGADCILIILGSVSDDQAAELEAAAREWGMDALLETHNEAELERALKLKSRLIGVNNRDLHSFETKLETTERLAPMIPADRILITESGIFEPEDWARMARVGARAALIGESLMRQENVSAATRSLIEATAALVAPSGA